MEIKIENIILIILKDEYRYDQFGVDYENMDAIFATKKTDFAGFSHAFLCRIVNNIYNLYPDKLHELSDGNLEAKNNLPLLVHTEIIANNSTAAESLMNNIIKFSRDRKFSKILLTQMIELKSPNNQNNFSGIINSIKKNAAGSAITIVIALDQRRVQEFYDLLK